MIISFGWTTPALLAGQKTRTRRQWTSRHAVHFKKGAVVDAWNTSPRNVKGNPHVVARLRLTRDSHSQSTSEVTLADDWEAEGFEYMTQHGLKVDGKAPVELWREWKEKPRHLYIVDFEVVEYLDGPLGAQDLSGRE